MVERFHISLIPRFLSLIQNERFTMVGDNRKVMLSISNTRCSYCSRVIEHKLEKMPGIADISVSYLMDRVLVKYDPNKTTIGEIRGLIKKLGYDTIEHH